MKGEEPPGMEEIPRIDNKTEYGERQWDNEEKRTIQSLLEHKLPSEHIAIRPGAGGTKFIYVESWKAIEIANSIFGFDGWSSQIVDITPDFIEEIPGGKFRVGVTAVVKVMLKDGTFHEDVGYGICENKSKGTAIENAKKEAVSDARKRALRVFGNALGNCIYDKEHIKKVKTNVKGAATGTLSYEKLRAGLHPLNSTVFHPPPFSQQNTENDIIIKNEDPELPTPDDRDYLNYQDPSLDQYPVNYQQVGNNVNHQPGGNHVNHQGGNNVNYQAGGNHVNHQPGGNHVNPANHQPHINTTSSHITDTGVPYSQNSLPPHSGIRQPKRQ